MVNSWFWTSSAVSHVGRERTLNEDAYLDAGARQVWAVADGMGGHDAGEVASRCVVDALGKASLGDSFDENAERIREALEQANQSLLQHGRAQPGGLVGSTVVVLFGGSDRAGVMWAGDSRAYRLRDGKLEQITLDHSRVQDLVERGQLTPEQAESHPQANVITRAVGVTAALELDFRTVELANEDCFLLCSDGLSRFVPPERIIAALNQSTTRKSCSELIEAALAANTRDNVTVVVARCREDTHSDTVFNPQAPRADDHPDDATLMRDAPDSSSSGSSPRPGPDPAGTDPPSPASGAAPRNRQR